MAPPDPGGLLIVGPALIYRPIINAERDRSLHSLEEAKAKGNHSIPTRDWCCNNAKNKGFLFLPLEAPAAEQKPLYFLLEN